MALKLNKCYFEFNSNTLESVRKEYNLDKPGAMKQSIDILEDWTQKQKHFVKKDLPREYLERFIIDSKGSVEKAKSRIDRLFTMRTMVPCLFEKTHAVKDFPELKGFFLNVLMPTILENDYRIHVGKLMSNVTAAACLSAYQHCVIIFEYAKCFDYVKGYYIVYDLNDVDIMNVVTNVDLIDLRNALIAAMEAYGFRIVNIFFISSSKMISALVKLVKQCISQKMGERIYVLKTMDALHEFLPRKHLPEDFGGEQRPIADLYDEMNKALCSDKHVKHVQDMKGASTNEELRSSDQFSKEYLGMPGSFKVLSID